MNSLLPAVQKFFDAIYNDMDQPEWTDVNLLMSHYDNFKNIIAPGWLPTLRAEPHGPPYPTP